RSPVSTSPGDTGRRCGCVRPRCAIGSARWASTDFTRDRRLNTLETPTLVIWGRDDKVNKPSGATMASGELPVRRLGGRVYVVTAGLRELLAS
ncbi:MAG: hypothetical protein ACLPLP_24205, partial [Mycobacterium sp.]